MKKAIPYIAVIGAGLVALYAVYHFRATRLLPQQLDEMRQAQNRLETAEGAEEGPRQAPDHFQVAFECSNGTFVVQCHREWAPNGVDRFYHLVKIGFYDDIRVFRVVPGFVAQFGISGRPALNAQWMESQIPDDRVTQSNTRGRLTFAAGASPNSRSTQVFINLTSGEANTGLDGRGFAPIAEVIHGMEIVDGFYSEYGEQITGEQSMIAQQGNVFLDDNFPGLTVIKRARILESADELAGSHPDAGIDSSEASQTAAPDTADPAAGADSPSNAE